MITYDKNIIYNFFDRTPDTIIEVLGKVYEFDMEYEKAMEMSSLNGAKSIVEEINKLPYYHA